MFNLSSKSSIEKAHEQYLAAKQRFNVSILASLSVTEKGPLSDAYLTPTGDACYTDQDNKKHILNIDVRQTLVGDHIKAIITVDTDPRITKQRQVTLTLPMISDWKDLNKAMFEIAEENTKM